MAASNTPKKSTTKRGTSAKKKSSARTQSKKNTAGKQSISSGFQTENHTSGADGGSDHSYGKLCRTWWKCRRKHQQGTHGSNGTDGLYFSRCTFYYGSISDLQ